MRTKTLLLTAVLGVAGVASTHAQAVYSLNAVGYVNLNLVTGYNLIANPLNAATNDIATILTNLPNASTLFKFNAASQSYANFTFRNGAWHGSPASDTTLNPGEGAFVFISAPTTVTFVGEVPQGSLSQNVALNYSIQSTPIPVSASLTNSIYNLSPNSTDQIFQFNPATQGFVAHTFRTGAWHPDYAPAVGEAFFYSSKAAFTWSVNFSVNN
jgi:hypothetical protein